MSAVFKLLVFLSFAQLFFSSAMAQLSNAEAQIKTFDVTTFGATADGNNDNQIPIAKAIAAATDWTRTSSHKAIIYFPAGTYNLAHVKGIYAIPIIGARNLTLLGQRCSSGENGYCVKLIGAPVTLNSKNNLPIYNSFFDIEHSDNITISGFYLDKKQPYFTQGKVISVIPSERTIEVQVDNGYSDFSEPWINTLLNTIVVFTDPTRKNWDHSYAACANGSPPSSADHDCHNFHIVSRMLLPGKAWKLVLDQTPPEEFNGHPYLMWRNLGWQPGFLINNSENVTVQNIFYTGGGGPALHVQASTGNIVVRNFTVDIPQNSDRLFSATSGFNGARNRANITLDHVHVALTDDDAVHFANGAYYPVLNEDADGKKITLALCYDGDFKPGDKVSAWNWADKTVVGDATVISSQIVMDSDPQRFPRTCDLVLDKSLPKLAHLRSYDSKMLGRENDQNDRIVNMSFNTHLTVENSYLSTMRARCAIIQVSADMIDNTCANVILAGFLVGPEFSWGEGYAVENVRIIGNKFENISGTAIYIADILNSNRSPNFEALIDKTLRKTNVREDNDNIVIQGNSFHSLGMYGRGIMGIRGVAITVENASNVSILENHFDTTHLFHRDAPISIIISPTTTRNVTIK